MDADKKRILIVDDEEHMVAILESRLLSAGYAVLRTTSGKEAIEIAKRELPDFIISDVLMPDVDGGDISSALETDPLTKNIPILFLTGLLRKEEEKDRRTLKGRYFMAKPYESEELLRVIAQHIR
jgi:CheY-like chemotaxis protein